LRSGDHQEKSSGDQKTMERDHLGHDSNYKSSLCNGFIRKGSCKRGANCNFAHSKFELRSGDNQEKSSGDQKTMEVSHDSKYKSALCAGFLRKGSCKRGANCTFAHSKFELRSGDHQEKSSGDQKVASAPEKKVCKFFQQAASCQFGKFCKYHHVTYAETDIGIAEFKERLLEFRAKNPTLNEMEAIRLMKEQEKSEEEKQLLIAQKREKREEEKRILKEEKNKTKVQNNLILKQQEEQEKLLNPENHLHRGVILVLAGG